uniref:C-type lectin domain-containing protein n=1 Tax=Plectus sambesii TaxID=2011161 RepID=A0A914VBT3_9BILA
MQQICGENIGGSNNVGVLPLPANSLGGNPLDDSDGTEVALRDPRISNTQLQLDNGVWLGAKLMDRGSFAWADGSEANFTKWKFGQPDRQSEDECIVSAFEPLQQWSDVPCNKPHGFVCALRPRMSLNQKLHQDFAQRQLRDILFLL